MAARGDIDRIVGEMIEDNRKRCGITQEKASEFAGISVVHFRNIIRGRSSPSWKIMLRLCDVLNIDPNWLYETYVKPNFDEMNV